MAIPKNERTHERPTGKVYNVQKAMISVDKNNLIQEVVDNATSAKFNVHINEEKMHLQTWFLCEDNECLGAYYVYIKKL